jgi:hypothetical protein
MIATVIPITPNIIIAIPYPIYLESITIANPEKKNIIANIFKITQDEILSLQFFYTLNSF